MNQNSTPSVSVIMSTYKEPVAYVTQAVESVLNQTKRPIEIIVVIDDCTNISVVNYLESVRRNERKVVLIKNEFPRGLAYCRNLGVQKTTGDYICLMDADDLMKPHRLSEQLQYAQEYNADCIFSHVEYINEENSFIKNFAPNPIKKMPEDILIRHCLVHPAGFFRNKVLLQNKYDERLRRSQDLDLWLRLTKLEYRFGIVPKVLLSYRLYSCEPIKDKIKRQRGYANYGLIVALRHYKNYWYTYSYYFFLGKRAVYFLITHLPAQLLVLVLRLKKAHN